MNYLILKPSLILAPFVKHYWAMSCSAYGKETYRQRIIPNGLVDLTFYFDKAPVYERNGNELQNNVVVSGQQNNYYDIAVDNSLDILSVVFEPIGVKQFLHIPPNEYFNLSVSAGDIFGRSIYDLHDKLCHEKETTTRIKHIESYLMKQLQENYKYFELRRISDSIGCINSRFGNVEIEELASRACLSTKQYTRTFSNHIGIAPKRFLRVVRLQRVLHLEQKHRNKYLTQLAYKTGYYDQAHMINDFKKLTGLTPTQFLDDCEPFSDYFS